MALNNTVWLEDIHALDVFSVRGKTDKNFNAILNYLKKEKTIKSVQVMERTKTYMILQLDTYAPQPIIRHIYKNNCFQLSPTLLERGGEVWTVGAPARKNITQVFRYLRTMGRARLTFISSSSFDTITLSEKQRSALNLALYNGYYERPRKITVTKLAKAYGLTKTPFLRHLRDAEIKIITQFANAQR